MSIHFMGLDSAPLRCRARSVLIILVASAALAIGYGPPFATLASSPLKVAIIVGPVGEELTPTYLALGEAAATAAEDRGATVVRAYSPNADAERVLAAVAGANIVVYLGHGVGTPNPYSLTPSADATNGWGLNGPAALGTHADSWADGTLAYYGEAWLESHARPAPGWVMIYSNACYAPGAGEGFDAPADEQIAAQRVSAYSRAPLAELGASAFFATDFHEGAAHLIATLMDRPDLPYGDVFASEPRYESGGVTRLTHRLVPGAETWLHRSGYFDGKVDYWYAFAGDPTATLAGHRAASAMASRPEAQSDNRAADSVDTGIEGIALDGKFPLASPDRAADSVDAGIEGIALDGKFPLASPDRAADSVDTGIEGIALDGKFPLASPDTAMQRPPADAVHVLREVLATAAVTDSRLEEGARDRVGLRIGVPPGH